SAPPGSTVPTASPYVPSRTSAGTKIAVSESRTAMTSSSLLSAGRSYHGRARGPKQKQPNSEITRLASTSCGRATIPCADPESRGDRSVVGRELLVDQPLE